MTLSENLTFNNYKPEDFFIKNSPFAQILSGYNCNIQKIEIEEIG